MSQQLSFSVHTILKTSTKQASELADADKVRVGPSDVFDLVTIAPEGNHTWVTLAQPLRGKNRWCGFTPHLNIKDDDQGHSPIPAQVTTAIESSRVVGDSIRSLVTSLTILRDANLLRTAVRQECPQSAGAIHSSWMDRPSPWACRYPSERPTIWQITT
ncbi:MAG: hypothetical protein HC771_22790 [Synechococcales cyanobacterium CRU_2_2]|nr:hypothetical protein [Synechococcales cyanobacterium CRU_2_2]